MSEKIILRNKLIINLKKYQSNLVFIKKKVSPLDLLVVIKANAYGMGYAEIINVLKNYKIKRIAISCLQEAYEARKLFKGEIHLLGDFLKEEIKLLIKLKILIPITNLHSAKLVNQVAQRIKKKALVQIYLDTGMGNLGLFYKNCLVTIQAIIQLPHIEMKGIFSHFAHADEKNNLLTSLQYQRFRKVVQGCFKQNSPSINLHISNSDSIFNFPEIYQKKTESLVRVGIGLFGVDKNQLQQKIKPCLSFKSNLISKKLVSPPFSIGYAQTYKIKKPTWIGAVSAGYADGLPFALSNQGRVLIKGLEFPIVGRLSMDYLTINLGKRYNQIKVGDEVTLLGNSSKNSTTIKPILVEEWSQFKKTHPYDILCSFGSRRLDKIYIK